MPVKGKKDKSRGYRWCGSKQKDKVINLEKRNAGVSYLQKKSKQTQLLPVLCFSFYISFVLRRNLVNGCFFKT